LEGDGVGVRLGVVLVLVPAELVAVVDGPGVETGSAVPMLYAVPPSASEIRAEASTADTARDLILPFLLMT
jgi:hypothetical protein